MTEVIFPSRSERRVLEVEAPGGPATTVLLSAPTIVAPGQPFALKIALADELGYPSVDFGGRVTVRAAGATPGETEVSFERGRSAVAQVRGITLAGEGLVRFEAELDGQTFRSNPVRCETARRRRIWWGDPHVHTVLSDCMTSTCRSLQFCYAAARWFAGLDFVCAADHVSNGRCTLGKWMEERAACDAWDDAGEFATLDGYEASLKGSAGGDNNVYFLGKLPLFADEYEAGNARTLAQKLRTEHADLEFIVVPHHTTRTGKHGEFTDAIYPGPDVMPVVEIHSKWGTSEYRGNPNPLEKIHPGPSYVVDLLNDGFPLGFIGGTDTHSTMPAGFGREHLHALPGLTAVMSDVLTRESVFRAIATRDCYATSLERIWLEVEIGGASMGRIVDGFDGRRPREIRASAAAASEIAAIDIVRNGETIHTTRVGDWRGSAAFTDSADLAPLALDSTHLGRFVYYYVRVTCVSSAQAWSSPVWLRLR